jgi:hypothetical protein
VALRAAGEQREVTVRVRPQRPGVRFVALDLDTGGGTVVAGRAEGRDVPETSLGESSLWVSFHAPPDDGLEISYTVAGGGPLQLRVVDGSNGLDGLPGYTPRPADVSAAGEHSADLVLVSATVPLR